MEHWLYHTEWLGNTTLAWVIAAGGALLGYIVAHSAAVILGRRLGKLAQRTQRPGIVIAAAVVKATRGWLLLLIAIAIALEFLHLGKTAADVKGAQHAQHYLQLATGTLVGIQLAFWACALVVAWLHKSARSNDSQPAPVMLGVLTWAVQFVVWVTLVLAVLSADNVNISAFVASLGVGGVAVALALQNVLGDLFSSISIGLDKPFEVGEFIAFGSDLGTVTKVGIKSTRIQSLSGEELAISNSVLLKNLIHNYTRMKQRRVVFDFGLPFETPREKVPDVVDRVRTFIDAEKQTRFDRGTFVGFGESGLKFEFVYYVLDPSYNTFVEIQQRINLKMLDAWDEFGIEFAVPTRKMHVVAAKGAPVLQVSPTKQ